MQFRNRRLIDYAVAVAEDFSEDVMLICGGITWISSNRVDDIPDLLPGLGPIGGIYTALIKRKIPGLSHFHVICLYRFLRFTGFCFNIGKTTGRLSQSHTQGLNLSSVFGIAVLQEHVKMP